MEKRKVTFVDPPSGWMYGFPKIIPDDVEDVIPWLVANGYPQSAVDKLGKSFYCRYWESEVEQENATLSRL